MKSDLISQLLLAINSSITETVLPAPQTSLGVLNNGLGTKVDLRSNGLLRNPGVETNRKTLVDYPKMGSDQTNRENNRRENSIESQDTDIGYDTRQHRMYQLPR